jgi:hypothetical protein
LAEVGEAEFAFFGHLCGSGIVKCSMRAVRVVILAKISQLSLQVTGIPENRLTKEFSTNGPDQPFNLTEISQHQARAGFQGIPVEIMCRTQPESGYTNRIK